MTHIVGTNGLTDKLKGGSAVILGNFDGVHRGHQRLVEILLEKAGEAGLQTVVFSFFPHPKSFFTNESFHTIYSSEEKAFILGELGLDYFVEHTFDAAFASQTPEEFVQAVLAEKLNCKVVVIGEGYRFGKGQAGDGALLKALGAARGIDVVIAPLVRDGGVKVSSSDIREHIRNARFTEASALLTRAYFIRGAVISGRRLGRTIGFPTANLAPDPNKLLPPSGVYATETRYDGKVYRSVTNVGRNPTVGALETAMAETFILDFDEDIHGRIITVDFREFIREERKFESVDALREQISKDISVYCAR